MGFSTHLTSAGTIWAEISYEGINGDGKVMPCVAVVLGLRTPVESVEAEAHRLGLSLLFDRERLAQAEVPPARIASFGTTIRALFPFGQRALAFVSERAGHDDLSFKLEISALLRVRRTAEGTSLIRPQFAVGEWGFVTTNPAELSFSVPRGVWFSSVVSPIGDARFVSVEIEIPKGADPSPLSAAFDRLRDAERCYAIGDDPGVFAQCRGAIEALPGYPDHIVDGIENPKKRVAADELVRQAGTFFHAGRHVSREGQDAGEFPVDHRDASMALNLARLLLAYLARL